MEPMAIPADNPLTREKVALGKQLFFDARLSADGATSCAGCHEPKYGYTIGAVGNRACPTLLHAGYSKGFYWEGAPIPLEKAILGMWTYAMIPKIGPTAEQIAARFGLTPEAVVNALASYLRTLVATDAAWVRFFNGDELALSPAARAGFAVFDRKARCSNCHSGVLLTDRLRHDVGTGNAYKTPTLFNIARSAPYFHDNRAKTLEDAVDHMLAGGFTEEHRDPQLRPVELTSEERSQLLAFLRELDADPVE